MASAFEEYSEEKKYAEESLKTKRAREKLRKQIEESESKITPEALKEKTKEIHRWIARHAHHRITLKNKDISLFDENQNTAKLSQRVTVIADSIQKDMKEWPKSLKNMKFDSLKKIFNEKAKT